MHAHNFVHNEASGA